MKKKGVSLAISWVLLMGFVLVLAISIFVFLKGQTEKFTEQTVTFQQGRLECAEVSINVAPQGGCSILTVVNRGKLNIDQLVIRQPSSQQLEVIPMKKINNELIGCFDKMIPLQDCTITLTNVIMPLTQPLPPKQTIEVRP